MKKTPIETGVCM